jgi:hypothetical protein
LVDAIHAGNQDALKLFVNRITLECFQKDGDLFNAVEKLRDKEALNIPYGDLKEEGLLKRLDDIEKQFNEVKNLRYEVKKLRDKEALNIPYDDIKKEQLLKRLAEIEVKEQIWHLSRVWVVPLLVQFAEVYDHTLLNQYKKARSDLDKHSNSLSPAVHHYWAKIAYRRGFYTLAIKEIAAGMKSIADMKSRKKEDNTLCTLGEGMLGLLVNILADLNLPKEGQLLCDTLNRCLTAQDTKAHQLHRLLDRLARLYLRQGKPESAITKYEKKRQESIDYFEDNGQRELAWLLYITAFTGDKDAMHTIMRLK